MKYSDLEYYVSQPRLNRYLVACGNSKTKAQKLYSANLRLSQAAYPVINMFEVILRNMVHYNLSGHFNNPNWIVAEKTGFMSHQSLQRSRYYLRNQVQKVESQLRRRSSPISAGKVISEQSLGFWISLFEPHHYRLIRGSVIHCFPNKPSSANRSVIHTKMQAIREFRNRVYHNEPVCFHLNAINTTLAEDFKSNILELLEWMSSNAKALADDYDNIDAKIDIIRNI